MPAPAEEASPLRDWLSARDVPCPGCGYNLRGLAGDRCPECNQHLVLHVALFEPRLAAFFAAVAGFLFGAGGAGVFLVGIGWFTVRMGAFPRSAVFPLLVLPSTVLVTFSAAAIGLMTRRGRRRFRAARSVPRALIVSSGWLLTAAAIAVFFLSVE